MQDTHQADLITDEMGSLVSCWVKAAEIRKSSLYNKFWLLRTTSPSTAGMITVLHLAALRTGLPRMGSCPPVIYHPRNNHRYPNDDLFKGKLHK
jgi:hypothetical protein